VPSSPSSRAEPRGTDLYASHPPRCLIKQRSGHPLRGLERLAVGRVNGDRAESAVDSSPAHAAPDDDSKKDASNTTVRPPGEPKPVRMSPEWTAEINARIEDIESGRVELISEEEVNAGLERLLGRARRR
jgi:hypothetical protein